MREEEQLIEKARASREETERFRNETTGREDESDAQAESGGRDSADASPLPEKKDPEPWAKTSSGDASSVTDDSD